MSEDDPNSMLVQEGKKLYLSMGEGMTDENVRAFGLFLRAAETGHSEAQHLVSTCYLYGRGVEVDGVECLAWLHISAESGLVEAQYERGIFDREGTGVAQDHKEAAKWFQKAAIQGHVNAQTELGSCYFEGVGVPQDYREAAKWFRRAAEQGNATSQHNLGLMFESGLGVLQDYSEAAKWYSIAAKQGNAGSQNNLGALFEDGHGVTEDYAAAAEWYQLAADGGDVNAHSNLKRLAPKLELKRYEDMVFAFSDLMGVHSPLIGDCAMLPHPKDTLLYAMKFVVDAYETKRVAATIPGLASKYENLIENINYLFTRLARDWHEIEPEDEEAVSKLIAFDSFPDWALPLKLKYIDEERASKEACSAALRVMVDRVGREKKEAIETEELEKKTDQNHRSIAPHASDASKSNETAEKMPATLTVVKTIGALAVLVTIMLGTLSIGAILIRGGVWLSETIYPWLVGLSALALAVSVLTLLPLSAFKETRGHSGLGIFIVSHVFGITLWLWSFSLTYILWGGIALFCGLLMFGVGVLPTALLATAFKGMWSEFGYLILALIATYGTRNLGIYLIHKAAEQTHEGPNMAVEPTPPLKLIVISWLLFAGAFMPYIGYVVTIPLVVCAIILCRSKAPRARRHGQILLSLLALLYAMFTLVGWFFPDHFLN